MRLTNEELKNIYFGAYSYEDTKDGYLQAFQYTKAQMDYFKKTSEFCTIGAWPPQRRPWSL